MCAVNSGAHVLDCDLPTIFYVVIIGMSILYTRHKRQRGGVTRRTLFRARYFRSSPFRAGPIKTARQRPTLAKGVMDTSLDKALTAEQRRVEALQVARDELAERKIKEKLGNTQKTERTRRLEARLEGRKQAETRLKEIQDVRRETAKKLGVPSVTLAAMAARAKSVFGTIKPADSSSEMRQMAAHEAMIDQTKREIKTHEAALREAKEAAQATAIQSLITAQETTVALEGSSTGDIRWGFQASKQVMETVISEVQKHLGETRKSRLFSIQAFGSGKADVSVRKSEIARIVAGVGGGVRRFKEAAIKALTAEDLNLKSKAAEAAIATSSKIVSDTRAEIDQLNTSVRDNNVKIRVLEGELAGVEATYTQKLGELKNIRAAIKIFQNSESNPANTKIVEALRNLERVVNEKLEGYRYQIDTRIPTDIAGYKAARDAADRKRMDLVTRKGDASKTLTAIAQSNVKMDPTLKPAAEKATAERVASDRRVDGVSARIDSNEALVSILNTPANLTNKYGPDFKSLNESYTVALTNLRNAIKDMADLDTNNGISKTILDSIDATLAAGKPNKSDRQRLAEEAALGDTDLLLRVYPGILGNLGLRLDANGFLTRLGVTDLTGATANKDKADNTYTDAENAYNTLKDTTIPGVISAISQGKIDADSARLLIISSNGESRKAALKNIRNMDRADRDQAIRNKEGWKAKQAALKLGNSRQIIDGNRSKKGTSAKPDGTPGTGRLGQKDADSASLDGVLAGLNGAGGLSVRFGVATSSKDANNPSTRIDGPVDGTITSLISFAGSIRVALVANANARAPNVGLRDAASGDPGGYYRTLVNLSGDLAGLRAITTNPNFPARIDIKAFETALQNEVAAEARRQGELVQAAKDRVANNRSVEDSAAIVKAVEGDVKTREGELLASQTEAGQYRTDIIPGAESSLGDPTGRYTAKEDVGATLKRLDVLIRITLPGNMRNISESVPTILANINVTYGPIKNGPPVRESGHDGHIALATAAEGYRIAAGENRTKLNEIDTPAMISKMGEITPADSSKVEQYTRDLSARESDRSGWNTKINTAKARKTEPSKTILEAYTRNALNKQILSDITRFKIAKVENNNTIIQGTKLSQLKDGERVGFDQNGGARRARSDAINSAAAQRGKQAALKLGKSKQIVDGNRATKITKQGVKTELTTSLNSEGSPLDGPGGLSARLEVATSLKNENDPSTRSISVDGTILSLQSVVTNINGALDANASARAPNVGPRDAASGDPGGYYRTLVNLSGDLAGMRAVTENPTFPARVDIKAFETALENEVAAEASREKALVQAAKDMVANNKSVEDSAAIVKAVEGDVTTREGELSASQTEAGQYRTDIIPGAESSLGDPTSRYTVKEAVAAMLKRIDTFIRVDLAGAMRNIGGNIKTMLTSVTDAFSPVKDGPPVRESGHDGYLSLNAAADGYRIAAGENRTKLNQTDTPAITAKLGEITPADSSKVQQYTSDLSARDTNKTDCDTAIDTAQTRQDIASTEISALQQLNGILSAEKWNAQKVEATKANRKRTRDSAEASLSTYAGMKANSKRMRDAARTRLEGDPSDPSNPGSRFESTNTKRNCEGFLSRLNGKLSQRTTKLGERAALKAELDALINPNSKGELTVATANTEGARSELRDEAVMDAEIARLGRDADSIAAALKDNEAGRAEAVARMEDAKAVTDTIKTEITENLPADLNDATTAAQDGTSEINNPLSPTNISLSAATKEVADRDGELRDIVAEGERRATELRVTDTPSIDGSKVDGAEGAKTDREAELAASIKEAGELRALEAGQKADLSSKEDIAAAIKAAKDLAESAVKTAKEKVDAYQKILKELSDTNTLLLDSVTNRTESPEKPIENDGLSEKYKSLVKDAEAARQAALDARTELDTIIGEIGIRTAAESPNLDGLKDSVAARLNDLNAQDGALRDAFNKLDQRLKELERLHDDINDIAARREAARLEQDGLDRLVDAENALARQRAEAEALLDANRRIKEDSNMKAEDSKANKQESKDESDAIKNMKEAEKIKEDQDAKSELEKRREAERAELEALRIKQAKLEEERNAIKSLKEGDIEGRLKEVMDELTRLKEELKRLEESIKQLKDEIKRLEEDPKHDRDRLKQLKDDLEKLLKLRDSLRDDIKLKEDLRDALKKELARLERERNALEKMKQVANKKDSTSFPPFIIPLVFLGPFAAPFLFPPVGTGVPPPDVTGGPDGGPEPGADPVDAGPSGYMDGLRDGEAAGEIKGKKDGNNEAKTQFDTQIQQQDAEEDSGQLGDEGPERDVEEEVEEEEEEEVEEGDGKEAEEGDEEEAEEGDGKEAEEGDEEEAEEGDEEGTAENTNNRQRGGQRNNENKEGEEEEEGEEAEEEEAEEEEEEGENTNEVGKLEENNENNQANILNKGANTENNNTTKKASKKGVIDTANNEQNIGTPNTAVSLIKSAAMKRPKLVMPPVPVPEASQIYVPTISGKKPKYIQTYREGYRVGYRKGYFSGYVSGFRGFKGARGIKVLPTEEEEEVDPTNGLPPNYTYYEILNIKENAKQKEIKDSYLKMIKATRKKEFVVLVNKANSVLSDPKKRRKYDADLKAVRAVDEPTGPVSNESGTEEETNEVGNLEENNENNPAKMLSKGATNTNNNANSNANNNPNAPSNNPNAPPNNNANNENPKP